MEIVRRLDAAWLREAPLRDLLAVLDGGGEEARVVGGAVRNAILAEPIAEIDVATTALPTEVVRRAQAAGFKAVPPGSSTAPLPLSSMGSRSRSQPCARMSRPSGVMQRWRSGETGNGMPSGATSP